MRKWFFLFATLLLFSSQFMAQEAKALLDHDQIKIGEQTSILLELRCPAATKDIMMPELRDTITKYVEIIEVTNIDTTFDEDDIGTKIFTQKITVTSWDSGFHAIPPFKFVVDDDTIKSKPLLLTVNTIAVAAEQDIKDIKEIVEVPFSLWDWILYHRMKIIIGWLIAMVALVGLLLYQRYMNSRKGKETLIVPKEAADKLALKKLDELEGNKYWQGGEIKKYHSELSFIVREYIENRFELRALELTTEEINSLVEHHSEIEASLKAKLYQLLSLADMAKFAKQQPLPSENESSLTDAYSFVRETAVREEESAETETEATETETKEEEEVNA